MFKLGGKHSDYIFKWLTIVILAVFVTVHYTAEVTVSANNNQSDKIVNNTKIYWEKDKRHIGLSRIYHSFNKSKFHLKEDNLKYYLNANGISIEKDKENTLKITLDEFKNNFNDFSSKNNSGISISSVNIEKGYKKKVFHYQFNDKTSLVGSINSTNNEIESLILTGRVDNFTALKNTYKYIDCLTASVLTDKSLWSRYNLYNNLGLYSKDGVYSYQSTVEIDNRTLLRVVFDKDIVKFIIGKKSAGDEDDEQ